MFCTNCGTQNPEGTAFCTNCGASLGAAPQPGFQAPAPQSNGALSRALAGLAMSPLFLVAIGGYTLSALLGLISSLVGGAGFASLIIGAIVPVLMCVGMWLSFNTARTGSQPLSTAGLSILKVLETIGLVLICIVGGIVLILSLFAAQYIGELASALGVSIPGDIAAGGILIFVLLAAVFAFMIFYYVCIVKTIGTVKKTFATGVPSDKVSGFVAVMQIIGAVFSLLGIILGIVGAEWLSDLTGGLLGGTDASGVLGIIGDLAGAAASVCFGLFLFKYKNTMQLVASGRAPAAAPKAPKAPKAPVAPVPPVVPAFDPAPYQAPAAPAFEPAPAPAFEPAPAFTPAPAFEPAPYVPYDNVPDAFGDTSVLNAAPADGFGDTTVLNAAPAAPVTQIHAFLVRLSNNEKLEILNPNFIIGKGYGDVDCAVNDNVSISRRHAVITSHDGGYFIADTGSRNGTFVDGMQAAPHVEIPLSNGTQIRLADEDFEFVLEEY